MKRIVLFVSVIGLLAANTAAAGAKPQRKAHDAVAARAQLMPAPRHAVDPYAVYVGGTYAGRDPDPNIRAQLIREFGRRGR